MKAGITVRWFGALCVLALAACGGGSIKSPDFTAELDSITVSSVSGASSVALGDTLQLRADGHFTAPPGQSDADVRNISDSADWASSNDSVATVDDMGLVTPLTTGTTRITASRDGITSAPFTVTVGPAVVRGLVIRTESGATDVTLAKGQSARLLAYAKYSDGSERLVDSATQQVAWSAAPTDYATVSPALGTTTMVTAVAPGNAMVTAKLQTLLGAPINGSDGAPISDTAAVTVTTAQPANLEYIQYSGDPVPTSATLVVPTDDLRIAIDVTRQAVVVATFTDGSVGLVAPDQLNWSISPVDGSIATASATGEVKGVAKGAAVLTATLKTPVPGSGNSTVSRGLAVTDANCTNPARAAHFTASGNTTPLLCLLCSVNAPENAIDADDTNFATLTNNVALLGGATALNVSLKDAEPALNTGAAPKAVKFLVNIDPGTFPVLNLELLNQLTISLHDNVAADASGSVAASGADGSNPLELSLLGIQLVPGLETLEISFVPPANVEYRRLRLTNSSILEANLTQSVKVSNACLAE